MQKTFKEKLVVPAYQKNANCPKTCLWGAPLPESNEEQHFLPKLLF